MWVWIGIGAVVVAVLLLFVFSLCKTAGDADRAIERFREEGWLG
ncbi:MAG TPA: hypothetical protein VF245_12645 [Solirubrobacterales bacterium]